MFCVNLLTINRSIESDLSPQINFLFVIISFVDISRIDA